MNDLPRIYVCNSQQGRKVFIRWPHLTGCLMTTVVNLGGYTDDVLGYSLRIPEGAVELVLQPTASPQ